MREGNSGKEHFSDPQIRNREEKNSAKLMEEGGGGRGFGGSRGEFPGSRNKETMK